MAKTPGLNLPFGVDPVNPVPVDANYGPYASLAQARSSVPLALRYDGLTVQITGIGNYWWLAADLSDIGLVPKVTGGGVSTRTTAVDTSGSAQAVTFDGTSGEIRVYRQSGSNAMTINAGVGQTFVGGGTSVVSSDDRDTITLVLNGTDIEVLSVTPGGRQPVIRDATLSGDGVVTDLGVAISTDPNNIITVGTDGALFASSSGTRVTAIDTSGSAQAVTFDGIAGETRVYRQDGANAMTINAGVGKAFVGGGSSVVSANDQDTITLTLNGTEIEVLSIIPAGSSGTNLSQTASSTTIVVASDTGTGATLGLATSVNAGLLGPSIIHPNTPTTALPTTANRIGEIFVRNGATLPGVYIALDLVGNWNGPLG